eukprot:4502906-Amphidinium_carterae.1
MSAFIKHALHQKAHTAIVKARFCRLSPPLQLTFGRGACVRFGPAHKHCLSACVGLRVEFLRHDASLSSLYSLSVCEAWSSADCGGAELTQELLNSKCEFNDSKLTEVLRNTHTTTM